MSDYLQRHHLYFPRRKYKTRLEKAFRQLPCNIQKVTAEEHRAIHKKYPNGNPGGKPSTNFMYEAIQRHARKECPCHLHP